MAGTLSFGNWYFLQYGKVEGMVDVIKAIKRSNDIFFYKTGERTGVEKIKKWADIFGLGKPTKIGFDEAEGIIPSTFWKKEVLKENWYLGDTYNLSIGQGYVGTTPLQTVLVTGVFANGGYLCKPQLLKVGTIHELSLQEFSKPKCKITRFKNLSLIREGMKQACSAGGTGWPLFDFKIQTACKTGTAESHAKSGLPHAWITVFAPYENPEIALTVLVEEGGQGSDVAGPIAEISKPILKAKIKLQNKYPNY
jgi:penicillin-binding protein 2